MAAQTNWGKLISGEELTSELKERKKTYLEKTIWGITLPQENAENGWEYYKDTRNPEKIKVRKNKTDDEVFENRLWVLFAKMGFHTLNKDRNLEIDYSEGGKPTKKQIDVFAADDETVLVVECKCAKEPPKTKTEFKKDIEAIHGYMPTMTKEIRRVFPKHNVKYIFATCKYDILDQNKTLMDEFGIAYFDEKTVGYYEGLVQHLGTAARFQLLGALFAGTKIPGLDIKIPAIQGKMGGYTYYSFSIQPETLLKIGFVLHRSEANDDLMPTYQRLIKKSRLDSVHKFIENGGFFPNSVIISIDTHKKKPLQFDLADLTVQGTDDVTKMGLLHLPNEYRSAYIIDGQHRLYGYSDSEYAETNSIPVVAFVNMDQHEQVKLFMEINENQKPVNKNLRNTLNSDLLWVSEDPSEKREAIRSKIAQNLGNKTSSPLHNRVIIGEDQRDDFRCITLEIICNAINATDMLTKFDKDKTPKKPGIMDLDDNAKTEELIEKYIVGCFSYLCEIMPDEWEKNPKTDGMLLFNNAVGGLIMAFGDIADELKNRGYEPKQIDKFLKEAQYYLDPIALYIEGLSDEDKNDLRSSYGTNGPRYYWRNIQRAIHEAHKEFLPEGYENYWREHAKTYNAESIKIMEETESIISQFIKKTIMAQCDKDGSKWIHKIPISVYTEAQNAAAKEEYNTGDSQDPWDFVNMHGFKEIVTYGNNWSTLFEDFFTLPSDKNKRMRKEDKTEWMEKIYKLQNSIGRASFAVSPSDYETLKEVETILPNLEIDNKQ